MSSLFGPFYIRGNFFEHTHDDSTVVSTLSSSSVGQVQIALSLRDVWSMNKNATHVDVFKSRMSSVASKIVVPLEQTTVLKVVLDVLT